MNLDPEKCEQFYRLWFLLLQHVNAREQLIPSLPLNLTRGEINPTDARILRDALWSSDENVDSFLIEQQDRLSEADYNLVASWRQRISGKFYMVRHLKKHTLFVTEEEPPCAYGVLGIVSPIAAIINWPLPVLVDATLLPFEDKIIYDSLLVPYPITFGSGIRKSIDNSYRTAKERNGIITSLDDGNRPEPRTAIAAGNRTIMNAFCKDMAAARLSSKMINQHSSVLQAFVAYLEAQFQPRSLLDITNNDIELYWSIQSMPINAVSFKRFVSFMLNTGRMDWETGENIKVFLKLQH